MMRSLSSAVAGLRTHQTKMDVIGNNIANVNTAGFKSSRATFADVYYQNLSGSKAGQAQTSGGKNPTQIGYGASVATIDVMMNVTGGQTTDQPLDVHITGEGFLVTKDVSGRTFYSRLGNMKFDSAGNLVDGNGYLVQGFPMKADEDNPGFFVPDIPATGIADSSTLRGIFCDPALAKRMTSIEISSTGQIVGLLKGNQTVVYSGSANWINDLNVPEDTSYKGPVQWSVSALYSKAEMANALKTDVGNIKEIVMGEVALPVVGSDGTTPAEYIMRKNGNQLEIEIKGTNPPMTLVGTLGSNNQIVFKSGNSVAMTVKLDPLAGLKISDLKPEPGTKKVNDYKLKTAVEIAITLGITPAPTDEADAKTALRNHSSPVDYDTLAANVLSADANPNTSYYNVLAGTEKDVATGVVLKLYEQIKTTDDGGNTVIRGRTGGVHGAGNETYGDRTDVPTLWTGYEPAAGALLQYGDFSFTLGNGDNMSDTDEIKAYMNKTGFNSVIANVQTEDQKIYTIGQLVLAKFGNPNGLSEAGMSVYTATNNSGEPTFVMPGIEGTGNTQAGMLEMSNVDISKEFTDMITTQRGFQANSRIVTVSDEMLQELVNLKR